MSTTKNQGSKISSIKLVTNQKAEKRYTFKSKYNMPNKTSNTLIKKYTQETAPVKERPPINVNFKQAEKDITKEIPTHLLCNICKKLVKVPTKCYQCNALFCKNCLSKVLEKKHKCPKCFKIISENLLKNENFDNEFKNTFIKCKHTGCKEALNLYDYEEHLLKCEFRHIKHTSDIDNLVYFNNLPFNEDPYSNNIIMDYSMMKVKNEMKMANENSYVENDEKIEEKLNNLVQGKDNSLNVHNDIINNIKMLEEDNTILDNKKNEVNKIIKELQSKIDLHEIIKA